MSELRSQRSSDELELRISELHRQAFPGQEIKTVNALPFDMSPRRYFRIQTGERSTIAMVFDSRAIPEARAGADGHGELVDSFHAVIRLTEYLLARKLPVPEIYLSSDSDSIILLEDFGDSFLADSVQPHGLRFYKEAIDNILVLQSASHDPHFFAARRSFSSETFYKEMTETIDFYLPWKNPTLELSSETKQELHALLKFLADQVAAQTYLLSLRDYHSWNLMVTPNSTLGIIDFQDALMAPRTYDLVALLNDRDTDSALGEESYKELLEYFFSKHPLGSELRSEYPFVLLQRDLKVAGRLAKMIKTRGLVRYEKFIPGTARRIARTIKSQAQNTELQKLGDVLSSLDSSFN